MMRRWIIGLCALAGAFCACTHETEVEELRVSPQVVQLQVGEPCMLTVSVSPVALAADVMWLAEDTVVATVFNGIVTGRSEGQTKVVARVGKASAECVVIVRGAETVDSVSPNMSLSRSQVRVGKSMKRGVGVGSPFIEEDIYLLAPAVSWGYNWGPTLTGTALTSFDETGMDFCPMAWNKAYNKEAITAYVQAHPECKYLLAYNEPNLTDQANMTPQEAAEGWGELVAFARGLGLNIVSPAMNYGTLAGYSDPVKWLDEFFAQPGVSIDDVCAISLHCYMGSAGAMKSFIDLFDKYGKPVWMTEFCAWEQSVSSAMAQINYMSEAVLMMEKDPRVERYAWFLVRGNGLLNKMPFNQLVTDDEPVGLSEQGLVYTGLSSFSEEYIEATNPVLANTCADISTWADTEPMASPHFYPRGDAYGSLYMQIISGQYAEYRISVPKVCKQFSVCYRAYMKTTLQVSLDGQDYTIELPRTQDDEWHTMSVAMPVAAGEHVLRITNQSGNALLHWFMCK